MTAEPISFWSQFSGDLPNEFDYGNQDTYFIYSIPAKPLRKHAQMWRVFLVGEGQRG